LEPVQGLRLGFSTPVSHLIYTISCGDIELGYRGTDRLENRNYIDLEKDKRKLAKMKFFLKIMAV